MKIETTYLRIEPTQHFLPEGSLQSKGKHLLSSTEPPSPKRNTAYVDILYLSHIRTNNSDRIGCFLGILARFLGKGVGLLNIVNGCKTPSLVIAIIGAGHLELHRQKERERREKKSEIFSIG